jgi:hypothetical protein
LLGFKNLLKLIGAVLIKVVQAEIEKAQVEIG